MLPTLMCNEHHLEQIDLLAARERWRLEESVLHARHIIMIDIPTIVEGRWMVRWCCSLLLDYLDTTRANFFVLLPPIINIKWLLLQFIFIALLIIIISSLTTFGTTCLSKYFRNLSINNGRTLAWTLLCPIPLMKSGSARYGFRTVSNNRSEWLNGTMLSLVPWMKSTGLRMVGAKSTLGNRSPGRVHPLSITIR